MIDGGRRLTMPAGLHLLRHAWERFRALQFGGPDLAARLALLVFAVAALTAARMTSFVKVVSDRNIPPIPPLIWLFHQADMLFLPGGNRLPGGATELFVQCFALALALVLFYLASRAIIPALLRRYYRPLAYAALPVAAVLQLLALQGVLPYPLAVATQPHHYGNDAITVTSCAIDELLAAENPYGSFRVIPCLQKNGMHPDKTTPLQAGAFGHIPFYPNKAQLQQAFNAALNLHRAHPKEFESYFSYPAAAFLVPAVFVALHLHDLSVVFLLCYLGMVALVAWRARGTARRMVWIVAGANAALWPTIAAGATDGLYAMLVLVAWAGRDRRWLSAIALGLAVASRQQAWFYLLFYAVLIERTLGRRELAWRLSIVSGIFVLTNLPFFVTAPGPWLGGVMGPIRDLMFPRGTGLIALSLGGAGSLPLGPRTLYGLLESITLLGTLVFYRKTCKTHPGTGLVLAPVALFFAWRSLYSYFLPISLLALYPALVEHAHPRETDSRTEETPEEPAEAA
jgi:hypothetical protein